MNLDFMDSLDIDEFLDFGDSNQDIENKITDEFDYRFDFSFFGLLPNTIYKEDINTILGLIDITTFESKNAREKLSNLLHDLEVLITHMEIKLNEQLPNTFTDSDAKEFFNNFCYKVDSIKEAAESFNYHKIEEQLYNKSNGNDLDLSTTKNILEYIDRDNVEIITESLLISDYDKCPDKCPASIIEGKLRGTLKVMQQRSKILDIQAYNLEDTKNTSLRVAVSKLQKLKDYTNTNYKYTEKEVELMKFFDFPWKVLGLESYFKPNIEELFEQMSKDNTRAVSKKDSYRKMISEKKLNNLIALIEKIRRKAYLNEKNARLGVNAPCIYF